MKDRVKLVEKFVGWRSQQKQSEKYSCWSLSDFSDSCWSTGSVDRQRSYFWPLGDIGRPPRSTQTNREHCQVPGRPERSADVHTCTACMSVDPSGRPASVRSDKTDSAETRKRKWVLILRFKDLYKRGTRLIKPKSMIIDQYSTCYIILIEKTFLNKNLFFQTWYFQNMLTLGNILK